MGGRIERNTHFARVAPPAPPAPSAAPQLAELAVMVALQNALDLLVQVCERLLAEVADRDPREIAHYLIQSACIARRFAADPRFKKN
jgi:hypothetical protein